MKWIALAAIAAGIGLVISAMSTMGDGATGLDRLPITILMAGVGALLVIVGVGYFAVRLFIAL